MPRSLIRRSLPLFLGVLLILLIPASTFAIPGLLNQQGHILDSTGIPVTGSADVTFALYNAPTGGAAQWSQTLSVTLDNGFYEVVLGSESSPLDTDLFDGSDLFLGITLDGQNEFLPRDRITAVPYAFRVGAVEGEVKAVGGLVVDGVEVVNDQQQWVGLGVSFTDLADVPEDWADGDDVGLEGSGTQGTLMKFTGSGMADSGMIQSDDKIGVGVSDPQSTFHIAGGIQLEDDTSDCVSGKEGTLRWHENALEVCDGTEWGPIATSSPVGQSEADAGVSCKTILDEGASIGDGIYWLDPDGDGGNPALQSYCDMTTDGGGWTRIVNALPVNLSEIRSDMATVRSGQGDTSNDSENSWVGMDHWTGLGSDGNMMMKCYGGTVGTQQFIADFTLDGSGNPPNYNLTWNVGCFGSYNSGRALGTSDYDRDGWSGDCVDYVGTTWAWESHGWGWHNTCHCGSYWDGGNSSNGPGAPICNGVGGTCWSDRHCMADNVQVFVR